VKLFGGADYYQLLQEYVTRHFPAGTEENYEKLHTIGGVWQIFGQD
jgi:hypothetical protein